MVGKGQEALLCVEDVAQMLKMLKMLIFLGQLF